MKDLKKFLEDGRPINVEEYRKQISVPTGGKANKNEDTADP